MKGMKYVIEKILPGLYKIEIPLPNNPLRALNSYVIKSPRRNLIIDTGMNRDECHSAMRQGLAELGIDLDKTDFFITHMHADHAGLLTSLMTDNSRAYCSREDAIIINSTALSDWSKQLDYAYLNGFPQQDLQEALHKHPGYRYGTRGYVEFEIVSDQDTIIAGDYTLTCIATPGHTEGHMCLYEPHKKILFSGDHILGTITPNISQWMEGDSPLREYLASLDKVSRLETELVLPAHRSAIVNLQARIEELKKHHQNRLEEILTILAAGGGDAYQVASKMKWDINLSHWDKFPLAQKWFATGEALAHLVYLEEKARVKREQQNGKYVFYCLE